MDKVYGESMVAKFRNNSIKLPCGCNVNQVSTWIEALNHMMNPKNCPTLSNKEQS